MNEFRDRVTLITGAGNGIGRQLATLLASEGARIAAIDRDSGGLDALVASLPNGRIERAVADVTDLPSLRAAVAQLESRLGPTDLLIACAGIGRKTAASEFRAEDVNAHIHVNLCGVVNSIDAVLAGMRQRRRGQLVALSSLASYRGLPLMSGYCAGKAGVNALLEALRVELKPDGIAVTTICPGWIRTAMTASLNLKPNEILSLEQACAIMLEVIRRRQPFSAFPARMAWQVRLLRYLPRPWSDWLAGKHFERALRLLKDNRGG